MRLSLAFHKHSCLSCLLPFLFLPLAHAEALGVPLLNMSVAAPGNDATNINSTNTGVETNILPATSRRRYATLSQDDIAKAQRHAAGAVKNSGPNEDPSGLGRFEFNSRGPGEHYDKETGTRWNGYRVLGNDGRYLQPDPIGLRGGINPYVHVLNSPLKYTDQFGLILDIDPSMQIMVKGMAAGSSVFNNLMQTLQVSPNLYKLRPGTLTRGVPGETICYLAGGCTTIIDPSQMNEINYRTEQGTQSCITMERTVGHELSHSQYHELLSMPFNWISPHSIVIHNENRIMNQLDPASPNRDRHNDTLYFRK